MPTSTERQRRLRRRSLATLGVVALLLFFAFWWAYSYYRDTTNVPPRAASPTATCVPLRPGTIAPETTTLNVYNATSRNKLAATAAKSFTSLGFTVGKVANDPKKAKVPGPALLRYGPAGEGRAKYVAKLLGRGVTYAKDTRKDATVDVVLGDKFTKVGPLPQHTGLPYCPPSSTKAAPSQAAS